MESGLGVASKPSSIVQVWLAERTCDTGIGDYYDLYFEVY
jgi:hypothetical protein